MRSVWSPCQTSRSKSWVAARGFQRYACEITRAYSEPKNVAVGYNFNMPYCFIHGQVSGTPLRNGPCGDPILKPYGETHSVRRNPPQSVRWGAAWEDLRVLLASLPNPFSSPPQHMPHRECNGVLLALHMSSAGNLGAKQMLIFENASVHTYGCIRLVADGHTASIAPGRLRPPKLNCTGLV